MEHARHRGSALDVPAQMIPDKLSAGILPREKASKTFAGYGTGSPCAGCDLAIQPTDVEHEMVFADKRSFAFHLACVTLWHALRDAPADGEWRVTCSCKGRIGSEPAASEVHLVAAGCSVGGSLAWLRCSHGRSDRRHQPRRDVPLVQEEVRAVHERGGYRLVIIQAGQD